MNEVVRRVLCCDFDGTLTDHSQPYAPGPIPDAPNPGALEALTAYATFYQVVIFSGRAETDTDVQEIIDWMGRNGFGLLPYTITPVKMRMAFCFLDDLGWPGWDYGASFPTVEELEAFTPWWKKAGAEKPFPELTAASPTDAVESLAIRAHAADMPVTETVRRVVQFLGGEMSGLADRLKTPQSLARKLVNVMAEKNMSLPQAAGDIKDALRYTAVFETDAYVDGVTRALRLLNAAGLSTARLRNYWVEGGRYADGTYLGVNVMLEGLNGYQIELQVHTPESLGAQEINWDFYRIMRAHEADPRDTEAMENQMRDNNAFVPVPAGVDALTASSSPLEYGPDGKSVRVPGSAWFVPLTDSLGALTAAAVPDGIPADVNYRESTDPQVSCGTCAYYSAGRCQMFKGEPVVSPSYVCDKWEAVSSDHAPAVTAERMNELLAKAHARREQLEEGLARILQPILADAGTKAAHRFESMATNHLTAAGWHIDALVAAADIGARSTMVAVTPRPEEAQALAEEGGEPPESLHVTLAYLGELDDDQTARLVELLAPVAGEHPPLEGEVGGVGAFDDNGNGVPAIWLPDVPGLIELRQAVCQAIADNGDEGIDYSRVHGYTAHATAAYRGEGDDHPPDRKAIGHPLHFDTVKVVQGDKVIAEHPLTGAPAVTAAGTSKPQQTPPWTSPAPDELINVEALVAEIKAKTEPVRQAHLREVMTPALREAGLNFDVRNPLVAKMLAGSAQHVTSISETTRLNVMKVIGESYRQGLSIPQTAKAIQAGMKEASFTRATMIARTELVGATSGGALAAAQIVNQATGGAIATSTWNTAPGAEYPRHEDYEGLDGQTVDIGDLFQVGDSQLRFPGDPDGPEGDTINCRCTLSFGGSASAAAQAIIDAGYTPPTE